MAIIQDFSFLCLTRNIPGEVTYIEYDGDLDKGYSIYAQIHFEILHHSCIAETQAKNKKKYMLGDFYRIGRCHPEYGGVLRSLTHFFYLEGYMRHIHAAINILQLWHLLMELK